MNLKFLVLAFCFLLLTTSGRASRAWKKGKSRRNKRRQQKNRNQVKNKDEDKITGDLPADDPKSITAAVEQDSISPNSIAEIVLKEALLDKKKTMHEKKTLAAQVKEQVDSFLEKAEAIAVVPDVHAALSKSDVQAAETVSDESDDNKLEDFEATFVFLTHWRLTAVVAIAFFLVGGVIFTLFKIQRRMTKDVVDTDTLCDVCLTKMDPSACFCGHCGKMNRIPNHDASKAIIAAGDQVLENNQSPKGIFG